MKNRILLIMLAALIVTVIVSCWESTEDTGVINISPNVTLTPYPGGPLFGWDDSQAKNIRLSVPKGEYISLNFNFNPGQNTDTTVIPPQYYLVSENTTVFTIADIVGIKDTIFLAEGDNRVDVYGGAFTGKQSAAILYINSKNEERSLPDGVYANITVVIDVYQNYNKEMRNVYRVYDPNSSNSTPEHDIDAYSLKEYLNNIYKQAIFAIDKIVNLDNNLSCYYDKNANSLLDFYYVDNESNPNITNPEIVQFLQTISIPSNEGAICYVHGWRENWRIVRGTYFDPSGTVQRFPKAGDSKIYLESVEWIEKDVVYPLSTVNGSNMEYFIVWSITDWDNCIQIARTNANGNPLSPPELVKNHDSLETVYEDLVAFYSGDETDTASLTVMTDKSSNIQRAAAHEFMHKYCQLLDLSLANDNLMYKSEVTGTKLRYYDLLTIGGTYQRQWEKIHQKQ